MVRQRLAETFAREDAGAHPCDDRGQAAHIGVAGKKLEPVIEPRAGLEQQRKIEREDGDVLGLGPLAERQERYGGAFGPFLRDGIDRHEAEIFDAARDLGDRRRRDRAGDDFAGLGNCLVAKVWHVLSSCLTFFLSDYRTVVTRSTSAADVMPARHFATASSIMVTMPDCVAAFSTTPESVFEPIRLRTGSVISRHSNTPERPR